MRYDYFPKLNGLDELVQIADFAEIECLRRADFSVSTDDICRGLLTGTGESSERMISSSILEEQIWSKVTDSFAEADLRTKHCGRDGAYPFSVSEDGLRLEWHPDALSGNVYLYLLLATRRREKLMKSIRLNAGSVFEELCAKIAERYWGGPGPTIEAVTFNECKRNGNFPDGINDLCAKLREGGGLISSKKEAARRFVDNKLDLIVWRSFSDRRPGKLIGFGQCKTGVSWESQLSSLQPADFIKKWITEPLPAVTPVRLFFIADRIANSEKGRDFHNLCTDAGILFDRCRIMEYAENLPEDLSDKIGQWVSACRKIDGLFPE